jgi:hypothetical protein
MDYSNRFAGDRRRRSGVSKVVLLVAVLASGVLLRAQDPATTGVAAAETPTMKAGPRVEAIASMRAGVDATSRHQWSYEFTVKDGDWLDTGVVVAAGEQASFSATGSMSLPDGRVADPDGAERGWKDLLRQFPLNDAKTGALVGRVSDAGASVPFPIGSKRELTVEGSGRLFLRANLSSDLAATGSYKVKMKFLTTPKMATSGPVAGVSTLISPETFAEVPRRVSDQAGHEGDMVNYALVGSEEQVEAAFKAAGWVAVDKTVEDAVLHGILSTLSHEAYTEMPMSTLYLFGRPQDLSFARGDPLKVAAERHHLRVWKTDKTVGGRPLWVGSATHDVGFEKDKRNGNVTHRIDPEIDKERDFLLQSFDAAGAFSSAAYVTPDDPMLKAKTATGGGFYSDGRIVVMALK